jgi:salicylate hydroxylase
MRRRYEIAVCGCGPAGLAAALLLARSGHRVRIFDQFDAPRPVGSGLILQPTGLGVLAELGLLERVSALGARIERLFGRVVPSNRVVLDVRYSALAPDSHGLAVHRATLFSALHQAVKAEGIEIVPETRIARVTTTVGAAEIFGTKMRRIGRFDLIVNALGANSPLTPESTPRRSLAFGALWATVPWPAESPFLPNALEQRYRRADRMAGVLPIGRRTPDGPLEATLFWSLRRSDEAQWHASGIAAWKAELEQLWPETASLTSALTSCSQLQFARYDHFTLQTPWDARVAHIGDAAHATSPQLGQGANMALLDALALAESLKGSADLEECLRMYERMRRWHIRLFQMASAAFTPFYQSNGRIPPFVRDWVAAPLSRMPIGRQIVARLVSGLTTTPLRGRRISE